MATPLIDWDAAFVAAHAKVIGSFFGPRPQPRFCRCPDCLDADANDARRTPRLFDEWTVL